MTEPRLFYVRKHQGKEAAYQDAMESRGYVSSNQHTLTPAIFNRLAFALFDHDIRRYGDSHGHRPELDRYNAAGIPVFIYPHAARPTVLWDAYKPWPHTKAHFVQAPGHVEVMEAIGYPCTVVVAGWSYCPLQPFQGATWSQPLRVLYAPLHPNANGWLSRLDLIQNKAVYKALLELPNIELTVRHIKHIRLNGLWVEKGVQYKQALPNGSYDDIDAADVVISHQTYAYIAVARGKPVVMYGETQPAKSGNSQRVLLFCDRHFEQYRELMRYPFEFESGNLEQTIQAALIGSPAVDEWRRRFIGQPFDAATVAEEIERYL